MTVENCGAVQSALTKAKTQYKQDAEGKISRLNDDVKQRVNDVHDLQRQLVLAEQRLTQARDSVLAMKDSDAQKTAFKSFVRIYMDGHLPPALKNWRSLDDAFKEKSLGRIKELNFWEREVEQAMIQPEEPMEDKETLADVSMAGWDDMSFSGDTSFANAGAQADKVQCLTSTDSDGEDKGDAADNDEEDDSDGEGDDSDGEGDDGGRDIDIDIDFDCNNAQAKLLAAWNRYRVGDICTITSCSSLKIVIRSLILTPRTPHRYPPPSRLLPSKYIS